MEINVICTPCYDNVSVIFYPPTEKWIIKTDEDIELIKNEINKILKTFLGKQLIQYNILALEAALQSKMDYFIMAGLIRIA